MLILPCFLEHSCGHVFWQVWRDIAVNMRDIEPRKEGDGFDGAFLSP